MCFMFRKFLLLAFSLILTVNTVCAENIWINDLRNLFLSNNAIILGINIRTFAAQDNNKNGIIDEDEESGNFLNAIGRLDEIASSGINTLHVLPIMELGKIRALGTAGSLYAPKSFTKLNPQFASNRTALTIEEQAIKFINEAHKRNIRLIVDVPACGSYDLFLAHPELFYEGFSNDGITPLEWTDVRLFDAGTENNVNKAVYNLYKEYVDYVMSLGFDGIRADVATLKPAKFWKDLITYSRQKDPQFMWLAESSDAWKDPIDSKAVFTPYNKLLEAGFDGFYGSYFNIKDWQKASKLTNYIKFSTSLNYAEPKAVLGTFSTHDDISPLLINGPNYSRMIMWLNATLPVNSYFVDGFQTGDNYIYFYGNKRAQKTDTDCNKYFVHRGKIDIFNFSRQPGGRSKDLKENFVSANGFKNYIAPLIKNGKYITLRTSDSKIFAYAITYAKTTVLVFGNIDFKNMAEATIRVPGFKQDMLTVPICLGSTPLAEKGKFKVKLEPNEVQVLLVNDFVMK